MLPMSLDVFMISFVALHRGMKNAEAQFSSYKHQEGLWTNG